MPISRVYFQTGTYIKNNRRWKLGDIITLEMDDDDRLRELTEQFIADAENKILVDGISRRCYLRYYKRHRQLYLLIDRVYMDNNEVHHQYSDSNNTTYRLGRNEIKVIGKDILESKFNIRSLEE